MKQEKTPPSTEEQTESKDEVLVVKTDLRAGFSPSGPRLPSIPTLPGVGIIDVAN